MSEAFDASSPASSIGHEEFAGTPKFAKPQGGLTKSDDSKVGSYLAANKPEIGIRVRDLFEVVLVCVGNVGVAN